MVLTIGQDYSTGTALPMSHASPNVHTYRPRGSAKAIFEDKSPEILVSGPYGTGKSRACLEKLHMVCMLRPNVRALISRSQFAWLREAALRTFTDYVAKEHIATGLVHVYGGSVPKQIQYLNGSTIDIIGLNDINRVMSAEYDLIYVQEATELKLETWERLGGRARGTALSYKQLLADCNPAHPEHWLYQRCLEGKTKYYESTHEENPQYFDDQGSLTDQGMQYITRLETMLSGIWLLRGRYGKWVGSEGVVYDNFSKSLHVIPAFKIPDSWPRIWSVDFGFTNPFVLQRWAVDPDGRLYLYAERYRTKMLVEDHARSVLEEVTDEKGKWTEPRPDKVICDHDAEDRATLKKYLGMGTVAAKKTVSDGLQAVHSRLKVAGDGKPRLFILDNVHADRQHDPNLLSRKLPTSTLAEIGGYVWDPKKQDTPVKENDHGMDAMRYVVADQDLRSEPRVRWLG